MVRSVLVFVALVAPVALAADGPAVEMEIDRIATASPDQMGVMADEAETLVAAAEAAIAKLASGKAAREGGAEGEDCTSDRLATVQALKSQSTSAEAAMRAALDKGDLERAASELRKLAVAAKESQTLADAAERCALGVTESTGRSRVTPSGGVGDPDADTAKADNDVLDVATDPPSASPF